MKAVRVHAFGGPDVLRVESIADPVATDSQVLVQVAASGVNPVDTYIRAGTYPMLPALPYTPGVEFAGTIVDGPRAGERVMGLSIPNATNANAEWVAVPSARAIRFPDRLSFAEAATMPVAFATAYRALVSRGGVKPNELVLVHGASGGVGQAAVQMARASGATVIGTASTEIGRQAVLAAGAAHAFDHRDPHYRDAMKRSLGQGFDLIIEMLANVNLDHDLDLLAPGGRVVIVGSRGRIEIDPRKTMGQEKSIIGMTMWGGGEAGMASAFEAFGAMLERQAIWPLDAVRLPFADAARAHTLVMTSGRDTAKVLLVP